jgi:hypothetical protein
VHNLTLALQGAGKVLGVGLLLGAGLPLVFALGIRASALGAGGDAEVVGADGRPRAAHPAGRLLAALCFAVVALAVALGITYVVATGLGKTVHLHGVVPTFS